MHFNYSHTIKASNLVRISCWIPASRRYNMCWKLSGLRSCYFYASTVANTRWGNKEFARCAFNTMTAPPVCSEIPVLYDDHPAYTMNTNAFYLDIPETCSRTQNVGVYNFRLFRIRLFPFTFLYFHWCLDCRLRKPRTLMEKPYDISG